MEAREGQRTISPSYLVPHQTLRSIALDIIKPSVLRTIKREQRALPVFVAATLHPALQQMVFGTLQPFTLASKKEILTELDLDCKYFKRGSYATLLAPLEVRYSIEQHRISLKINYEVYNHAGILQWPVNHDEGMKDMCVM